MATFWTNQDAFSPLRRRNFRISVPTSENSIWWWAKSVTKPSYDIAVNEYQITNQKHKYPGLLTWNDVTIRIVDFGEKAKELVALLGVNGFISPSTYAGQDGIEKAWNSALVPQYLLIEQYGEDLATPVEQWGLGNCFIKSINFGELDYSSDELIEIEIIVSYDWAEIEGVTMQPAAKSVATARPETIAGPSSHRDEHHRTKPQCPAGSVPEREITPAGVVKGYTGRCITIAVAKRRYESLGILQQ